MTKQTTIVVIGALRVNKYFHAEALMMSTLGIYFCREIRNINVTYLKQFLVISVGNINNSHSVEIFPLERCHKLRV